MYLLIGGNSIFFFLNVDHSLFWAGSLIPSFFLIGGAWGKWNTIFLCEIFVLRLDVAFILFYFIFNQASLFSFSSVAIYGWLFVTSIKGH